MELYKNIHLDSGQKNDESLTYLPTAFFSICSNLSSSPITKKERGDRDCWWVLHFINLVIQAGFNCLLWFFKNSMNQTSLAQGWIPEGYPQLSLLLSRAANTKEGHIRSRLFVANSSPLPTKHSFQRHSSGGRPSRVTEFVQGNTATCLLVWFFEGVAIYLHFLRIPYKQSSVFFRVL